ncbi:MAG: septal ring lytic transglycosylase RlpA family protein [Cellvibrionaceae bacterium]|nr:septal ring lytic transglycosylase RlpA family protein [Cellvibrionaceae bacterium]
MSLRLLLLIGLLTACAHPLREVQDGGPTVPVDVSGIQEPRPQTVIRTAAGNRSPYTVLGKTYRVLPDSRGYRQRGLASWYGTKFHGRRTANGEVYDMFKMTAAHKTLPIPSYVRVTHVGNGLSVVVKINDRGPFHHQRIIDLSYAAARKLGIDQQGTALVEVVDITPDADAVADNHQAASPPLLSNTTANTSASAFLQVGAFRYRQGAVKLQQQLATHLTVPIVIAQGDDHFHRVKIGPLVDTQQVRDIQQQLQHQGVHSSHLIYHTPTADK